MSPRPGGEADKFGARYEGAWTVWRVLDILRSAGTAITVEVAGELADGAEFLYERAHDSATEAHQVKRQQGTANGWTAKSLSDLGIWADARQHIEKAREFHFASTTPATKLNELADRARRSDSLEAFIKNGWLTRELKPQFDELAQPGIYRTPLQAWTMLRSIFFHWLDEDSLVNHNAGMSGLLLEGAAGRLAAIGLGDLVVQNLGVRLDSSEIEGQLSNYGLSRTSPARSFAWDTAIIDITDNWRASVRRELLIPMIARAEAGILVDHLTNELAPTSFLVGSAGGGKSATLMQAVDALLSRDMTVLSFRLDRIGEFSNTQELGQILGLDTTPVAALASKAKGQPCVLVIDQLDAVSLASGRIPTSFAAIEDLVREAAAFTNMHVALACRQFDVDNDYRIRTLQSRLRAETVTVAALTDTEVNAAVDAMGLDSLALGTRQRSLLRLPLHLVLLTEVADEPGALQFESTAHLFDAYWRRKRQMIEARKSDVRFMQVMAAVTTAISNKQQLAVSDTVLDAGNLAKDGDAFISEHVLVRDGQKIAFFHEAFFDYAFARQWAESEQTIVLFLTSREQALFRRAQVRQILHHLRDRDTQRYLSELRAALLSPDIRFHLKDAMMAVLGSLSNPTAAELSILLETAATDDDLAARAWQTLRSDDWFSLLDSEGELNRWLNSGVQHERDRAVQILGSAVRVDPNRVAEILQPYRTHHDYFEWVFRAARFADLQCSRPLFGLYLDAVRAGGSVDREHLLWPSVYTLADNEPSWAIELLKAYYVDWPGGLELNEEGKAARLSKNDHALFELIQKSAAAEPALFVASLLPYMLDVMRATVQADERPPGMPSDPHFSYYYEEMGSSNDADDALLVAMRSAIAALAKAGPDAARPTLEMLAEVQLSSAQSLLYRGLIAGGQAYADWSASLLLEGVNRLFCGTISNSVWVASQLMQVIAPNITRADHSALEDAVRDLRFEWEGRRGGYYAFTLLAALETERLSPVGKRRLGEYRRKFESAEPATPPGITGGWIRSPISNSATPHMSNENWLQAIARHDVDKTDYTKLTGGARELSHLLQQETKANPLRFAKLAIKFGSDMNSSYADAILLGIGEAEPVESVDQELVFGAVRHIASLRQSPNDRWLGHALRKYLKDAPLDLVEVIRDCAVSASDPMADRDEDDNEGYPGERLRSHGINSTRGSAAEELGNLLIYDTDGARTAVVEPVLEQLAEDPVIAVRSQVAHTIAASLRFARPTALAAFSKLVDCGDLLLAGSFVQRLMMYIGGSNTELALPVIERMIASEVGSVRQRGGALAMVAALDWSSRALLDQIMSSDDSASRKGVAGAAAARQSASQDAALAAETLTVLFNDTDKDVREAAAQVAPSLRDRALRPHAPMLLALINSASYEPATPQLFITLQHAPDDVGRIALCAAQRFIEVFGAAAGDVQTAAAGDTHYVIDLVIRGLAQSHDPTQRSALLDVIDKLMKIGAYGVTEAIDNAGR